VNHRSLSGSAFAIACIVTTIGRAMKLDARGRAEFYGEPEWDLAIARLGPCATTGVPGGDLHRFTWGFADLSIGDELVAVQSRNGGLRDNRDG
jgi:hypothetical protein